MNARQAETLEAVQIGTHCANCGKEIPSEQPESVRGFCNDLCMDRYEEEVDAMREDDDDAAHDRETSAADFESALADAITETFSAQAETFVSAGVMTRNRGLVVTLPDGTTFQLSIVEA